MIEDMQKRAIELCLAAYRITDKFPKQEILTSKIRAISIDIIEFLAYNNIHSTDSGRVFDYNDLEKTIQVFDRYCYIAQRQGWVRGENFQILRSEYQKLYRDLADLSQLARTDLANKEGEEKKRNKIKNYDLSERQENIIKFLDKSKAGATMEDLAVAFAVSKKTIERHTRPLVKKKLIHREGNTRSTKFFSRI